MKPKEIAAGREFAVEVLDAYVEEGSLCFGSLKLRRFQEEALRAIDEYDAVVLEAPTGAGKTAILAKPSTYFLYGGTPIRMAVGIYPSRALAEDQMRNLYKFLIKAGAREAPPEVYRSILGVDPVDFVKIVDMEPIVGERLYHVLLLVTSETLDVLRKRMGANAKSEVLQRLFEAGGFVMTVFTVPEYPYLLLFHMYGDFDRIGTVVEYSSQRIARALLRNEDIVEVIKEISKFLKISRTLPALQENIAREMLQLAFIDEFHLYSTHEIPKLLALIFFTLYTGGKVVLSSATPSEAAELVKAACRVLNKRYVEIKARTSLSGARIRKRTRIVFKEVVTFNPGVAGLYEAQRRLPEVVEEKIANLRKVVEAGVRAAVLGDRLAHVFRVAKLLENEGFRVRLVTSVRIEGLYDHEDWNVLVGSLAISYGVDIEGLDYAIVYAKDASSLIQKIGRVGRHEGLERAEVIVLVNTSYMEKLSKRLQPNQVLRYEDFVKVVRDVYPRLRDIEFYKSIEGLAIAYIVATAWFVGRAIALGRDMKVVASDVVNALNKFVEYVTQLATENVSEAREKVLKYIVRGIKLTPRGFYELAGFRDIVSVPVLLNARGRTERVWVTFSTLFKNFVVQSVGKDLKCDIDNPLVVYPAMVIDKSRYPLVQDVKKRIIPLGVLLHILNSKLHQVKSLKEVVSYSEFSRKMRYSVVDIVNTVAERSLWHVPALYKESSDRDFLIYLSVLWDAIPIYVHERGVLQLQGVVMLL